MNLRNTSTDVEKTLCISDLLACFRWKHLHGRGEDVPYVRADGRGLETPPRTWRRLVIYVMSVCDDGNTSTDVEKTSPSFGLRKTPGKHLHGRGEDNPPRRPPPAVLETPPRTWRRRRAQRETTKGSRNTSTDVEKTPSAFFELCCFRKHLHGRGEDVERVCNLSDELGNTSTDVEKTNVVLTHQILGKETPPRTWRRPCKVSSVSNCLRNTSTDVEKTDSSAQSRN